MNNFAIYGSAQPPVQPMLLHAGAVSLLFERGEIRYLRVAGRELLRRVYVAVRDRNWRTIEGQLSDLDVASTDRTFDVSFRMTHVAGAIRFSWKGRIEGDQAGAIRFTMDGVSEGDFLTNRTGVCVLHPASCAGAACTITHTEGATTTAAFPVEISPHQPFKDIRAITHKAGEADVRVQMEGDVFEMEDQRNWSDGSFKTYCRPLELPYPYELKAGTRVRQVITIEVEHAEAVPEEPAPTIQSIDLVGAGAADPVPQIGLAVGDGIERLDERSIAALCSLGVKHLRVDVDLADAEWQPRLQRQSPVLRRMQIPLELAVRMAGDNGAAQAKSLVALLPSLGLTIARWLILPERGVTQAEHLQLALSTFSSAGSDALIGGGTDAEFVAINRASLRLQQLDFVSFSLNPQVHATDDLSLMENLEAQADVIASAVKLSANAPVSISPVTLRRRFNPDATASETSPGGLPASVDPRQMSLLSAAWTVGSLSRLCHADFLTYFETHGWRGVMQGPEPSPYPAGFPANPGDIFPVYHVLKSVLTFGADHWLRVDVPRPLELAGLLMRKSGRARLLLANLTSRPSDVALTLLQAGSVTMLDASNVEAAMSDAEFWINAATTPVDRDVRLTLGEYAIAQVDCSLT